MFRQVKRTVTLGLQSGAETQGIDPDRKEIVPRAALINSEHFYPNIIILNEDSNKMDTSEYSNSWSNSKDKQSWNSGTFTESFSPYKHLDEWSDDSGCSSMSNAENTQCDWPHVCNAVYFDAEQPKHLLAAERRRRYASKNKSTSVYDEIIDCNALRRRIVVKLSYKDVSKNKRNTQQSHKVSRKFEYNWQKYSRRKIKRRTIFLYSSLDDLSSEPRHHTYYECKRYQGTNERTGKREQHNRMYVHEYISGICVDRCLRHAYCLPDRCVRCHLRSREKLCSYSPIAKRLSKRSLQLYKSSSSFENDYEPYNSASMKRRSYQKIAQHSGEFLDVRRRRIDIWKVRHPASLYIPISRHHGNKKKDFKAETVYSHLKSKHETSLSLDNRPSADSNCTEFSGVRSEPRCPESTMQKQFQRTSIKLKMLKRQQAYNKTSKDSDIHISEDEHKSEEIDPSLSRERSITIKPDLEYFKKKNEIFSEVEEEKFRHIVETSLEGKVQKYINRENRPINIFLPNSKEQEYCANIEEIELKETNV
ncbi:hypothetical protein CHS0354_013482 [Potamilus streckersoni]|uniref:Uncharacterized protein n=1 Tax=Potamilus streckersoni TaxID=2493646 RepID=A0AAE0W9Y0_9BIVA|nr:hypothetical protein CHS0354_013482 [Potamilus streckersoni]